MWPFSRKRETEQQRDMQFPRRAVRGAFDAAAINRLTSSWKASVASIDFELRGEIDLLRRRSREMSRNNEYAKKFLRLVRTNVVGKGFVLQPKPADMAYDQTSKSNKMVPDTLAKRAIEDAFRRWSRKGVCEVSGRYSFADIQRTIISAGAARDGEFIVRMVRGRAAGNEFGFALQVLDIDRLDTNYNISALPNGGAVIMGIEVDRYRRPVGYWMFKAHPYGLVGANREREFVPAADIIHGFMPDELEQARGVPWMHAAIRRLHDIGGYTEAAIVAARVGAAKMGFITTPDGGADGMATGEGTDGVPEIDAEAGSFPMLPEGYGFTPFNPDYPHAQFDMFMKAMLRGVAAGFGVSYNGLANDLENVNFSSIRSGVLEEREVWMELQEWFAESFLVPVYEEWLGTALLKGAVTMPNGSALPAAKLDKFMAHAWQGRRWPWVDPQKDMAANVMGIQNGLTSPQRIAAQQGVDVEDVLNELKVFQDMVREKGVELAGTTIPSRSEPKPGIGSDVMPGNEADPQAGG